MDYIKAESISENEVGNNGYTTWHQLTQSRNQGFSKPSGLKPPSQVPKISSAQGRPLGELQESNMNSRSAIPPPTSSKHKPSGCKLPTDAHSGLDSSLIPTVPEPAFKRKTLMEKAAEFDRKLAAPPTARPIANGVKSTIARGFAASTSRINPNKSSKHIAAPSHSGSVGPGARVPSGNARPKSAYGQHARSKSHHQGMRPATAMMKQRDEEDEDERLERKGVHRFPLSTIPQETLNVSKNAHVPGEKRPNSLTVAPKRAFHMSESRAVSSPSNLRSTTPIMEEPADSSCDDICNTLGALALGAPKAVNRDRRVGCGTIPGKEPNPFLKPPISQLPRATPMRHAAAPTPSRPPSSTPRTRAPFLNRFTNDRCPDFYDDRMEAMEREFRMFKEKMEGDMQTTTDYKETIQQLQGRGMFGRCRILSISRNFD
jgi:kinesin family protein C1